MQVWVGIRVGSWAAEPKTPLLFINQDSSALLDDIVKSYKDLNEKHTSENIIIKFTGVNPIMVYPFGENPEDPNSKVVCIRPYNV